jgi:hypothetical protein
MCSSCNQQPLYGPYQALSRCENCAEANTFHGQDPEIVAPTSTAIRQIVLAKV